MISFIALPMVKPPLTIVAFVFAHVDPKGRDLDIYYRKKGLPLKPSRIPPKRGAVLNGGRYKKAR